jgi:hypothetical protein
VSSWPTIAEPELLERLAMDDGEFAAFTRALLAKLPPRQFDEAALARALGYPWPRPGGSYRLASGRVELLEDLTEADRERTLDRFATVGGGRLPVLAFGSNAAPEALERKFAHLPAEEDRAVLALTGHLHDFDVGVAPQPAFYGAMPATLFPSPGTAVRATVLWVTSTQFTQLTWSELSYRLGRLHTRFDVDEGGIAFDDVLAFVSRFGAFCVGGEPVALAAVPAVDRTAPALTQEELLDAAASLVLGPDAGAEALVRAVVEDFGGIAPRIAATAWKSSLPFASQRWVPFEPVTSSGQEV